MRDEKKKEGKMERRAREGKRGKNVDVEVEGGEGGMRIEREKWGTEIETKKKKRCEQKSNKTALSNSLLFSLDFCEKKKAGFPPIFGFYTLLKYKFLSTNSRIYSIPRTLPLPIKYRRSESCDKVTGGGRIDGVPASNHYTLQKPSRLDRETGYCCMVLGQDGSQGLGKLPGSEGCARLWEWFFERWCWWKRGGGFCEGDVR